MNLITSLSIVLLFFIAGTYIYALLSKLIELEKLKIEACQDTEFNTLTALFIHTSTYYYEWARHGMRLVGYAFLIDAVIEQLIKALDGDLEAFRKQVKQLSNKHRLSGDLTKSSESIHPPTVDPKKDITDEEINRILDEWEKKHPGWRDKKDETEDNKSG